MTHPLLYEINARAWLSQLAAEAGHGVTLGEVPANCFAEWRRLGFTHIWLMGVWTGGPRARACALRAAQRERAFALALPDLQEEDIIASPYAIGAYEADPVLGGEEGLRQFRQMLHAHRLRLVLDFVPNHLGLDHPWVRQRPELFVQAPAKAPETFRQETDAGPRWLAHGKDPNFAAWSDTAQLDYRREDTRTAMTEVLAGIAQRCDGVRCDMAMLLLSDVFAKTWKRFSASGAAVGEFWPDAISSIKQVAPDLLFLAEVYWGLEARLCGLGFDYAYDKELYDCLVTRRGAGVQEHLRREGAQALGSGVHFLENHDEPRVASLLTWEAHRAAALLMLCLPGMRFLHQGQLSGARVRTPVQLRRHVAEAEAPEIRSWYEHLLALLPTTAVGQGTAQLLEPTPAWPGNPTDQNFVVVQWQALPARFHLLVTNLAPHRGQCRVRLAGAHLANQRWRMRDLLSSEQYERDGGELAGPGLYLDVAARGGHLFEFRAVG